MSWIVQNLVRNSPALKSTHDIDSDEYNNLLLIEKEIDRLIKLNILSQRERTILEMLSNGATTYDLTLKLNSSRVTIDKEIKKVCELLAYFLGGEFTDAGYLNYMQEKYSLSDDEISSLKEYMNGKYSKRIKRKSIHAKTI